MRNNVSIGKKMRIKRYSRILTRLMETDTNLTQLQKSIGMAIKDIQILALEFLRSLDLANKCF